MVVALSRECIDRGAFIFDFCARANRQFWNRLSHFSHCHTPNTATHAFPFRFLGPLTFFSLSPSRLRSPFLSLSLFFRLHILSLPCSLSG